MVVSSLGINIVFICNCFPRFRKSSYLHDLFVLYLDCSFYLSDNIGKGNRSYQKDSDDQKDHLSVYVL